MEIKTFGVELEAGFDRNNLETLNNYLMEEWDISLKGDGSIRSAIGDAREIASPIFNISQIDKCEQLFKEVYEEIVDTNKSMGLHIHIGLENEGKYNALFSRRFINFFCRMIRKRFKGNEELLKRFKNRYCKRTYPKNYFLRSNFNDRYFMINWGSFRKFGTLEFRIFDSPKNCKQLMEYLVFTLSMVELYLAKYEFGIEEIIENNMGEHSSEEVSDQIEKNNKEMITCEVNSSKVVKIGGLLKNV